MDGQASELGERFRAAAELVVATRDLLSAREDEAAVVERRGWLGFLEGLDEATLIALEVGGLHARWPAETPATLRALIAEARDVCAVPSLQGEVSPRALGRRESPRKRAQVAAFARILAPVAERAARVIDVGSGHGHLTRAISSATRPTLGLERDARLAAMARALATEGAPDFVVMDVLADGIPVARGDCLIGLHACGELGDRMVETAARVGAAVVLVGCCLQKRRQDVRAPLAEGAEAFGEVLRLPRGLLGLSNLVTREHGVEASRAENLAARERRLALRLLYERRGIVLRPGAELEGHNRRLAHAGLGFLVARAFAARGLAPPAPEEVRIAEAEAAVRHALRRRAGLPRTLLGRLLEVFVLLDRAARLRAHGYEVRYGTLFTPDVSPRNLVLVGTPPRW